MEKGECLYILDQREWGGVYEEAQHASSLLPARAYSGVGGRAGKGK